MVFEAWCGGDDGGGAHDSPAALTRLRYVHAVMETAISASVGHPNVVRVPTAPCLPLRRAIVVHRSSVPGTPLRAGGHVPLRHEAHGRQRRGEWPGRPAGACLMPLLSVSAPHGASSLQLNVWHARLQIIGGDATMTDAEPPAGMRAFKVFLIQVSGPRCLLLRLRSAPPSPIPPLSWCSSLQELCTCSLTAVLEHGAILYNPQSMVRCSCVPGWRRDLLRRHLLLRLLTSSSHGFCFQGMILGLLHQLALGLEYLHGMGIIHGGAPLAAMERCCVVP